MKKYLTKTMAIQTSSSQSQLNHYEKSEINVRTKAPELIGRLTCV